MSAPPADDAPPPLEFCDHFDQAQAEQGLPALFVLNARGELRLVGDRTRDAWQRLPQDDQGRALVPEREVCHCLVRDHATGWVQYVLATSWALLDGHPRADVRRYATQGEALAALAGLGAVPVVTEGWSG